ncbi:MAG: GntR family transcriptional regulator [Chloroflexi bacterium]|nr:GntR family transcriptional regulator [Chloroflexota bacterium]
MESILTGKITPAQHLVEQTLADQLKVSRIAVREALRQLAKDQLVEIVPNRGAFVFSFSPDDVLEIYALRAALESMAVERVIQRGVTPDDINGLQRLVDSMRDLEHRGDRLTGAGVDTEFHRTLMQLSHHRRAIEIWGQMSTLIRVIVYHVSNYYPEYAGLTRRHQYLVDLIRTGDEKQAVEHVKAHISEGAQHLVAAVQETDLRELSRSFE